MNKIILRSDGYKFTHYNQIPKDAEYQYSYWCPRGGEFPKIMLAGLQYILKKHFVGQVVGGGNSEMDYAERRVNDYMGRCVFNRKGWERIRDVHRGRLPLEIKAVPEGTMCAPNQPMITIVNTDLEFPWLTNYIETILSHVWGTSTVATSGWYFKQDLLGYLNETTDEPYDIDYRLNDFGFRGVTCCEEAGVMGLGHLFNFKGTDNFEAVEFAKDYYNEWMAGNSIPASEHATVGSWGIGEECEGDMCENFLITYPIGTIACVSDTNNIYNACRKIWGGRLKDMVLARDGVLVVRPDSGHAPEVVPNCMSILGDAFGYIWNKKGYRVLNPHIRIIQGDKISRKTVPPIYQEMKTRGWSFDNLNLGSGGGLIRDFNRDDCKCAIKGSAICRNGIWHDMVKNSPGKSSLRGRFENENLKSVLKNGELLVDHKMCDIRDRIPKC